FVPNVPNFVWKAPPERNYIDHYVFAKLQQMRILPSELCTDNEFIRRAYLDAIGILPTPAEVQKFLADPSPERRAKLIDELIGDPDKGIPSRSEYADFWTLKWADLLRNNRTVLQLKGVNVFQHWIR